MAERMGGVEEMTAKKIASIADAEKAIEALYDESDDSYEEGIRRNALMKALEILRELKAGVRKRLKLFELCDKHPETKCEDCQNVEICKTCTVGKELLRRVLEGEK